MHKSVRVAAVFFLLLASCQKARVAELEKQTQELAGEKERLQHESEDRERRIVESFTALNELYDELAKVDEDLVALKPKESGQAGQMAAVTEATRLHIANIREELEAKRQRIEELTKKNEKAGIRIASLNGKIRDLNASLERRRVEVEALIAQVDGLNQAMAVQGVTIETQKQHIGKQEKQITDHQSRISKMQSDLDRVWLAVGNEDQLTDSQIIHTEGGFLFGWGGVNMLNLPMDDAKFTESSVLATEIGVPAEVEAMIPPRSAESYRVEQGAQGAKVIILKPEVFWQERHLAIIVK